MNVIVITIKNDNAASVKIISLIFVEIIKNTGKKAKRTGCITVDIVNLNCKQLLVVLFIYIL